MNSLDINLLNIFTYGFIYLYIEISMFGYLNLYLHISNMFLFLYRSKISRWIYISMSRHPSFLIYYCNHLIACLAVTARWSRERICWSTGEKMTSNDAYCSCSKNSSLSERAPLPPVNLPMMWWRGDGKQRVEIPLQRDEGSPSRPVRRARPYYH